ncbi:MAG TPA: hypothetical protein PK867_27035, partial [Pirellulales bacterium]|nr:hypothetical protein [Pirellulales bacterium]
ACARLAERWGIAGIGRIAAGDRVAAVGHLVARQIRLSGESAARKWLLHDRIPSLRSMRFGASINYTDNTAHGSRDLLGVETVLNELPRGGLRAICAWPEIFGPACAFRP